MPPEPLHATPPVALSTSPSSVPVEPPWTSEALLLLDRLRTTGLWSQLLHAFRLPRGKAGDYEPADYTLVLILYAISGAPTLRPFFDQLTSVAALLARHLGRRTLPSRTALSRFLKDCTAEAVDRVRALLFTDLLTHGLRGNSLGGLVDRAGATHVFIDVDGTRQVARQRALRADDAYPPAKRRLTRLCAPGYTGRKRGEAVRTRTSVQQAHTREWIDTRGAPGNGTPQEDLAAICATLQAYAKAHALGTKQLVVRLDGLYGFRWAVRLLFDHELGVLVRCAHYALLDHLAVTACLSRAPIATYTQAESGVVREVFDVPSFRWEHEGDKPLDVRLLITRRRVELGQKVAVGVRRGEYVYELFVTDRAAPGLMATDLLGLYFGRASFETSLSHEDQETDADRWCSGHPPGQELWQLLAQWVGNVRVQMGHAANDPGVRSIVWAPALPTEPVLTHAGEVSRGACAVRGQVCNAVGRGSGQYGPEHFQWTERNTLRCPAGAELRVTETRGEGRTRRVIYVARASDCEGCVHAIRCRGHVAGTRQGRRVSVRFDADAEGAQVAAQPVRWIDVPAHELRRSIYEWLRGQRVECGHEPPLPPRAKPPGTRARREHRRLSWEERRARNAIPRGVAPWPVHVNGVTAALDEYLRNLSTKPANA